MKDASLGRNCVEMGRGGGGEEGVMRERESDVEVCSTIPSQMPYFLPHANSNTSDDLHLHDR